MLERLSPDALLFVGDLSDGDLRLTRRIAALKLPVAVILGNHDRGRDRSGGILQQQLNLLGERHCAWQMRRWTRPALSVVGARPCSAGGGFQLSGAVEAVYGPVTLEQSAARIVDAASVAPEDQPLVLLAHSGPTGLGSEANSPCGRDWKTPAVDWGDQDLAVALDRMARRRSPDLVVFGHMHHQLKRGRGVRRSLFLDRRGTPFVNAACVPRCGQDQHGRPLLHLSWAEFRGARLSGLSHRWYSPDAELMHEESLHLGDALAC